MSLTCSREEELACRGGSRTDARAAASSTNSITTDPRKLLVAASRRSRTWRTLQQRATMQGAARRWRICVCVLLGALMGVPGGMQGSPGDADMLSAMVACMHGVRLGDLYIRAA